MRRARAARPYKGRTVLEKSPFRVPAPPRYRKFTEEVEYITVEERMRMLKGFSADTLLAAIDWPGTQMSVRRAAQRMLERRKRNG